MTYEQRRAAFATLGPFKIVGSVQHKAHPGDDKDGRPPCAACGSERVYFFYRVQDKMGQEHLLGEECRKNLGIAL